MPYTLLLPDNMTPRDHALLTAARRSQRVPDPAVTITPVQWLEVPMTSPVLSVGKGALDLWHSFGLIRVGHNHGDVFQTRVDGKVRDVMVLGHPGAMDQLAFTGSRAREDFARDLLRFRLLLAGEHHAEGLASGICGGCLKMKEPQIRAAHYWVAELDMVGLCEDHYRKRARYTRKPKKRVNPSSVAGQMKGQGEMFADGKSVMVSKS